MSWPNSRSLLADIVATCSITSPFTSEECFSRYCTTLSTAKLIPSFNSLEFKSLCLSASNSIACANTVAVVVPSPASVTVFLAASFKSLAPMFSTGSNNITESATVTPSFVILGLPPVSSSITHLPLAPNVELTACVSFSIPLNIADLASSPKLRCFTIVSFI